MVLLQLCRDVKFLQRRNFTLFSFSLSPDAIEGEPCPLKRKKALHQLQQNHFLLPEVLIKLGFVTYSGLGVIGAGFFFCEWHGSSVLYRLSE